MKVYVEELPKDCLDCPCESEYYCNLLKENVGCCKWGEINKNCPLQPIADYTKQVRKEVAEEIKSALRKNVAKMMGYRHCYPESAIYWDEVVAILDKIGEKKC